MGLGSACSMPEKRTTTNTNKFLRKKTKVKILTIDRIGQCMSDSNEGSETGKEGYD
jgi:hypothetical protein